MAKVTEVRLSVTRTVNLGNYESVKIEAAIAVNREDDLYDTPESMREEAMREVRELLSAATEEHVPKRRGRD